MGYYKNLEIALQVEEPDRIPAPKAATQHLAYRSYDSRVTQRRIERLRKKEARQKTFERIILVSVVFLVGAIGVMGWIL